MIEFKLGDIVRSNYTGALYKTIIRKGKHSLKSIEDGRVLSFDNLGDSYIQVQFRYLGNIEENYLLKLFVASL